MLKKINKVVHHYKKFKNPITLLSLKVTNSHQEKMFEEEKAYEQMRTMKTNDDFLVVVN